MESNNGRMVSRHSSSYSVVSSLSRREKSQSSQQQPQPSGLCCNRCRKNLATTVFVCKCDCVFCEDCTYQHFNESSSCPCCRTTLGADDFMELCIADPSAASQDSLKNAFQDALTKSKQGSPILSYSDICHRLLKSSDNHRRVTKFLMKQFVVDSNSQGQRSMTTARTNEKLTQENTQLKQASSSQRIQYDQTIADLQNRLSAMTVAMQEKDKQIAQYRQHYASEGMARLPTSNSYGSNSHGGRRTRARSDNNNALTMMSDSSPNFHHPQEQQQQPPPPIQGFVMQKQAREREKEQSLSQMTRGRVPLQAMNNNTHTNACHPSMRNSNNNNNSNNMMMSTTPIVMPQQGGMRPSSSGSGGSSTLGSGRVRDIRASNSFSFGTRSSHQQQQQRRAPSTAFAFSSHDSSRNSGRHGYGGGRR